MYKDDDVANAFASQVHELSLIARPRRKMQHTKVRIPAGMTGDGLPRAQTISSRQRNEYNTGRKWSF